MGGGVTRFTTLLACNEQASPAWVWVAHGSVGGEETPARACGRTCLHSSPATVQQGVQLQLQLQLQLQVLTFKS